MAADKRTAIWLSHTSTSDYLKCPRSYFLKNVYKDPTTGHKIKIVAPSLSLGQTIHEVLEGLSVLKVEDRFSRPLFDRFDEAWKKVSGPIGGFLNDEVASLYKTRGREMLTRVTKNPGPLKRLAVKINTDLPFYFLSEDDNIILCGKIDWLEYLPESDSVHIIDFKTGKHFEDPESLQLPIYHLLVHNTQQRAVTKASYWYLESSDAPEEKILPDLVESEAKILKLAKEVKLARTLNKLACPKGGCDYCTSYEEVVLGHANKVGSDNRYDYYAFNNPKINEPFESEVL